MEGMESKLSALLNDPASMEKVMTMAKSLSGGQSAAPAAEPASSHGSTLPAVVNALSGSDTGDLIKMMSSIDPKMLNSLSRIIGEYNRPDDERVRLLHALKPYMREERRSKMDQAVNLVKLAHTARIALETLGGGR